MILAHIQIKVNKSIGFVLFLLNLINLSWYHFKLCLEHQRICAWIEKLFAESIAFVMLLWNETTLYIFELVSFQTLLIKPEDVCMYKTRCSKTIGVLMFLYNETTLFIFEMVSFQTLLIKHLDCCPYVICVPKPRVL